MLLIPIFCPCLGNGSTDYVTHLPILLHSRNAGHVVLEQGRDILQTFIFSYDIDCISYQRTIPCDDPSVKQLIHNGSKNSNVI